MDDRAVMRHLRNDDNIESWVCQFCGEPFPYDVHPEVIRHHLTWKCERTPGDVKEAAQRIEEDEFSISVEEGSNFNAQTEGSRYAGRRQVEAAERSISVNWEPTRILNGSENSDSNFEAEIGSNIFPNYIFGWVVKAALRWSFYVEKKVAERRAHLTELRKTKFMHFCFPDQFLSRLTRRPGAVGLIAREACFIALELYTVSAVLRLVFLATAMIVKMVSLLIVESQRRRSWNWRFPFLFFKQEIT